MRHENNIENNEEQNVELKTDKKFLLRILIIFILILIILFGGFFTYKKYKQYDFQKRYKNAPIGSIIRTSNMNYPRSNHVSIKLKDGNVLIVGGNKGAELFNPKTGVYKLIDRKLENITFDRNNYFYLDNGDVILANKYRYVTSQKKIININNYQQFFGNTILNGNSLEFSNTYKIKDDIIFSFYKEYSDYSKHIIACYNQTDNTIHDCKNLTINKEYLLPFNRFFKINSEQYIIAAAYSQDLLKKYKNEIYIAAYNNNTDFLEWNIINNTYNNINLIQACSYYIENIMFKNNFLYIVNDSNIIYQNLLSKTGSTILLSVMEKIKDKKNIKFLNNKIIVVFPDENFKTSFYIFDLNGNLEYHTKNIKFPVQNAYNIRKTSYSLIDYDDKSILINGGKYGIDPSISSIKDSYIIKITN